MLFTAGQIGIRKDGTVPHTIDEQADLAFANVIALLKAHGLTAANIVKLNTHIVQGHDFQAVRNARLKHLGDHRPASSTVFVSQLVHPDWLVEVDVVAAIDAS